MKNYECFGESAPFMKLGDSTNAPSLNYNIPQKNSFTAFGPNIYYLPEKIFNDRSKEEPHIVSRIQELPHEELMKSIKKDIENGTNSDYIKNLIKVPTNSFIVKNKTNTTKGQVEKENALNIPISTEKVQKITVDSELMTTVEKKIGYDLEYLTQQLKQDKAALVTNNFGSYSQYLNLLDRPKKDNCLPMIFIVEEYKTVSYLGDYGAGKTLSTFSLLPGEKTTISVKSFHEKTETKSRSENILDSFSKNSASNFEDTLSHEGDFTSSSKESETDISQHDVTNNISTSVSASASLFKIIKASVNFSYDRSGFKSNKNVTNTSSSRDVHVKNLSEAIEKHTNSTNASREVEINTNIQSTETIKNEKSVIREINNPNQNRVLNFVFRQLLQEYISITYLNNIKIVFTNGHSEKTIAVSINELDKLLEAVIKPEYHNFVRDKILHDYLQIENYRNNKVDFLELVSSEIKDIESEIKTTGNPDTIVKKIPIKYYKKKANLEDIYQSNTGDSLEIKVPGVILNAQKSVLRTSSVVVDSVLGQGNSLDCFNMLQQQAAIKKLEKEISQMQLEQEKEISKMKLEQEKINLAFKVISELPHEHQAEAFKTIFNDCCNSDQITINNK